MADWQQQVDALLARLRPPATDTGFPAAGLPLDDQAESGQADAADALGRISDPLWCSPFLTAEEPFENVEVSAVRTEIEATLRQVAALERDGSVESVVRDDVVRVLYALTRPSPAPAAPPPIHSRVPMPDSEHEWQLTSAAAVLRFCRLVTRLTNAMSFGAGS
jgi:hypothetical protein